MRSKFGTLMVCVRVRVRKGVKGIVEVKFALPTDVVDLFYLKMAY